jgi:oxygen-dependent protoporphyrinogen oxidase
VSRFLVVGGGLSGLSAAWRLREFVGAEAEITVLEASATVGGKALTTRVDGWLVEHGPTAFLMRAGPLQDLVAGLGIEQEIVAPATSARLLYRGGALRQVTANPLGLVWRGLLSPGAALRLCLEPFVRGAAPAEESVFDFAARRFGRGVAEALVAPMLLGVSASDAREVSVDAVFPEWRAVEERYGSMIRGQLLRGEPAPQMVGLRGGVQTLSERLASSGRFQLNCGSTVTGLRALESGFEINLADGDVRRADGLIVALPPKAAAKIWPAGDVTEALAAIEEPPVCVAAIGFPATSGGLPEAFGALVARGEGLRTLGIIFESALFEGRAPEGQVLLRVLLGGGVDPSVADLDETSLKTLVCEELKAILGVRATPTFWHLIRWPQAIPQGGLGHRMRRRQIEAALDAQPGLALAGTGVWGIGVEKAVASGFRAAERLRAAPSTSAPR